MASGYAATVMHSLLEFQRAGYLCDTVVVVDDGLLKAHSAVLAAVSPLFKAALKVDDSPAEHTVILSGVGSYTARIVLEFVYTGDIVIPDDCLASDKVTEIFSVLQELGLQLPSADKRSAEVNAECGASYCDEFTETSEHGNGEMVSSNKTDAEEGSGVVNLNGVDIHLDAVDMTLDDCVALGDQPVASGETEDSETEGGRLPRSASSRRRHRCGHCGRICSSPELLREHCSVSHGVEDCLVPPNAPARADKIQLRLSRRGLSRKHPSCWICGRVCSSLAVLRGHFALKHSAEDQSVVGDEHLLRSKAFLRRNEANGLPPKPTRSRTRRLCAVCGTVCRDSRDLDEHSLVHDGVVIERDREDAERRYVCEVCGKVCSRPSALASHRRFHVRDGAHRCVQCGRTFTLRRNLVRHRRTHAGDRPLICEHCGRAFMHRASLRDHKLRQHGDKAAAEFDRLAFSCRRCGERFARIALLRRHVVAVHRPARARERCLCNQCGRSFSCKFTLAMHMRLHTGIRPHRCGRCDRSFPTAAALRQHSFRHTNDHPHVCSTCGKRFAVPSALAGHMRVHTGEKPFGCEQCGRAFGQRCHLKQHVLSVHVTDKSLQCSECSVSFSRPLDLKRHYLHTHQSAEFVTQP